VTLLHGLGMLVYAEGVADADDAAALWDCRVDGITGPWVSAQRGAAAG
jgi:EAL domain-containing protein (putative c-di-GMP-specific phosphodiesterase class I)